MGNWRAKLETQSSPSLASGSGLPHSLKTSRSNETLGGFTDVDVTHKNIAKVLKKFRTGGSSVRGAREVSDKSAVIVIVG